jgi:hypothetical protein
VASSICLRATIFKNPEWTLWTLNNFLETVSVYVFRLRYEDSYSVVSLREGANFSHWIQQSRYFSLPRPHLRTETNSVLKNVVFSSYFEFRKMDRVQKHSDSEVLFCGCT